MMQKIIYWELGTDLNNENNIAFRFMKEININLCEDDWLDLLNCPVEEFHRTCEICNIKISNYESSFYIKDNCICYKKCKFEYINTHKTKEE